MVELFRTGILLTSAAGAVLLASSAPLQAATLFEGPGCDVVLYEHTWADRGNDYSLRDDPSGYAYLGDGNDDNVPAYEIRDLDIGVSEIRMLHCVPNYQV